MIKPGSLRAALTKALPALASNPDKLTVFLDQGSIVATGTRSPSFEYRYVLNVLLMDFAGDADEVFAALVDWVHQHEPELCTNTDLREHGMTFEIDMLDNATVDVSIKLLLTESVFVSVDEKGRPRMIHVDGSDKNAVPNHG